MMIFKNRYTVNNYNIDKFDRIEIVKGANGLMSGAGNPAASINMIKKHANSRKFIGIIDTNIGTWDTYKLKADVSTPLNEDGSIRARFVASHKETDTFKERYHQENDLYYAVLDADITDNTVLSVGTSCEKEDRDGTATDFPAFYTDGTRTNFSRSKNYTPNWLYWNTEITSHFANIKHYFHNDISINMNYNYNDIETDRFTGWIDTWNESFNKDGSGLNLGWMHMPQNIKENNVDIYSSIPLRLADKEHEFIVGFQYNKQKAKQTFKNDGNISIDNYFTSNGSKLLKPDTSASIPNTEEITKQTAFLSNRKV